MVCEAVAFAVLVLPVFAVVGALSGRPVVDLFKQ